MNEPQLLQGDRLTSIVGHPGDSIVLNWFRVKNHHTMPPGTEAWMALRTDGALRVFVGREPCQKDERMGWHISMSHSTGRLPSYYEMKHARYHFIPDPNITMVEEFPPDCGGGGFVNKNPGVRHLWEQP